MQYFNGGLIEAMFILAIQYMFLHIYGLDPAHASSYFSIIMIPWSPKIIYGIITDSLPIMGSGKRSYIFIMGMLQTICCLLLFLFHFEHPGWVVAFAMLAMVGQAFMDVVTDGLMVINSRIDPNQGSEELQIYSWVMSGVGGIVACLLSGHFLTGEDANGNPDGNPYILFIIMAVFAAALGISGLFINKKFEENQAEMVQMGLWKRTKFVLGEVKQGLSLKELYTAVIFRIILGSIVPAYGVYLYYY